MAEPKLNKRLYNDINRLKLLDQKDKSPRFRLHQSPFPDDDDEVAMEAAQSSSEFVVTGQIFPTSEIYNQRSYLIEMKLIRTFPFDPPEVRFLTPIYHINVAKDGKICNELLQKTGAWTPTTSLVQVVQALVDHIDHPELTHAISVELAQEYRENRQEFNHKALDFTLKHGLQR